MAKVGKKPAASNPPKAAGKPKATGKPAIVSQESIDDAWASARQHVPSGPGNNDPPEIPDGKYLVQVVSAKTSKYKSGAKQGVQFFSINYAIHGQLLEEGDGLSLDPEHAGVQIRSQDDLDNSREIGGSGKTPMILLSERLQYMTVANMPEKVSDFPALAKRLGDPNDEDGKMFLVVTVKTTYKAPDPERTYRPDDTLIYQNVYVNERWDADDAKAFLADDAA